MAKNRIGFVRLHADMEPDDDNIAARCEWRPTIGRLYNCASAVLADIACRRSWLVLAVTLAIGLSLLVSFPRVSFFTGRDHQIVNFWPDIERQSETPLSMDGIDTRDRSSHQSKAAFRLTLPVVMYALHANWATVLGIQYAMGVLILYLVGKTAYEMVEDRIVSVATVLAAAFIYAGKAAFLQLGGIGDAFAYAFLMVAIAFARPVPIALSVFAACFTDERAFVGALLVGVYWAVRGKTVDLRKTGAVATGMGIGLALGMRLFLHKAYGLYVPVGDRASAGLDVLPRTLPHIQYLLPRVFAGLWLWPIGGVAFLARDKQWSTILLVLIPVVLLVLVSFMVLDTDRSLAYTLPLLFIGMAVVSKYADTLATRSLAIWAMLFTLMFPANNFFSGDSRYSPGNLMPVELVRLIYFTRH